jgi:tryptophan synthase alpha chain
MANAIDSLFSRLRAEKRKALMPFTTAGDPDLDFTAALIKEFAARGSHVCEVGIPYSDPIADGPVIQASYTRALAKKIRLAQIFDTLRAVTPTVTMPVVTMVSYAIVYRHGLAEYIADAKKAGVAGAIVPDLPVEESQELSKRCCDADFSLIQLVTPTTPRDRAIRIAETSTGFLYYVSVTGITGERTQLPPDLAENVAWVRQRTSLPICIGFGIGTPDNVRMLAPVADGLIVGSAIVRRVAQCDKRPREEVLADVGNFVSELLAAMKSE